METEHDVQLSAVLEFINITQRQDTTQSIMSPFESLPPELMRNIFQYVPEAMFELKLTSLALNARVDEFVRERATFQLVDNISMLGRFHVYDEDKKDIVANDPGTMRIWMEVPIRLAPLFELRVKSRLANWADIISRDWDVKALKPGGYVKRYSFDCDTQDTANDLKMAEWNRLVESFGPSVRKVAVSDCYDCEIALLFNPLEQLHFMLLEFETEYLSETESDLLLKTVKHHKTECLSLQMAASATSLSEFLLELSAHLRALHYRGNYDVAETWTRHIIGMLSRKLDTLEIDHYRPDVLSRDDADYHITRLPFLGKKVWFKINFDVNIVGRSNKLNGHIIHEMRFATSFLS